MIRLRPDGLTVDTNFLHADLKLKEQALAKTTPTNSPPTRFKPDDALLFILNNL